MPRVRPLSPAERKKEELRKWIKGKKASEDITEAQLGQKLGSTQQNISRKIKNGYFTFTELVVLFAEMKATDEEILKLLRPEGKK